MRQIRQRHLRRGERELEPPWDVGWGDLYHPLDPPESSPTGGDDPGRKAVSGAEREAADMGDEPHPIEVTCGKPPPISGGRPDRDGPSVRRANQPIEAHA